jgi:hypothetical protein
MDRRDFVTFDADFPDDAQWDEQDNPVLPGGRLVAEAIREKLQIAGVSCSAVSQHSFYGWAFDANAENAKVSYLLQAGEGWLPGGLLCNWLLRLEPQESLLRRWFGPFNSAGFESLQTKVHDILTGDKRFSKVLWYTRADYESGKKERANSSPR